MDARNTLEKPKTWSDGRQHYIIFNHSKNSTTEIFSKTETLSCNFVPVRTNSLMKSLREDTEVMSDAESSCYQLVEVGGDEDYDDDGVVWCGVVEGEQCIDGLSYNERVRKKLELLARMVGVDNSEPGVVLAAVVSVLKDLKSIHCLNDK